MYGKAILTTVAALAAAAALALCTTAAPAAKVTNGLCMFEITAQNPPKAPTGTHFGHARCRAPLGKGVQFNSYSVTPASPTSGEVAGSFRNYFSSGTTRGTFRMTFEATSPTNITYVGTVRVRTGTGAFSQIHGTGTIACTTTDGGAHKTCTVKTRLRGI